MCAAPKGNQYYKLRSKDGRDKIFETPEDLSNIANEYFEWCEDNPIMRAETVTFQGSGSTFEVPILRPFSIEGFCNYADIAVQTFIDYSNRKDFIDITTRIKQIIYNQQFDGASTNLLNASIIARKLGLKDSSEIDLTSKGNELKGNNEIDYSKLSDQALREIADARIKP